MDVDQRTLDDGDDEGDEMPVINMDSDSDLDS
jgi:hypothetical protein